jgi:hypothetical protein
LGLLLAGQPGVDHALGLALALQRAVLAEVVVAAVEGDDRLPGPLIEAVGGKGAAFGAWPPKIPVRIPDNPDLTAPPTGGRYA